MFGWLYKPSLFSFAFAAKSSILTRELKKQACQPSLENMQVNCKPNHFLPGFFFFRGRSILRKCINVLRRSMLKLQNVNSHVQLQLIVFRNSVTFFFFLKKR